MHAIPTECGVYGWTIINVIHVLQVDPFIWHFSGTLHTYPSSSFSFSPSHTLVPLSHHSLSLAPFHASCKRKRWCEIVCKNELNLNSHIQRNGETHSMGKHIFIRHPITIFGSIQPEYRHNGLEKRSHWTLMNLHLKSDSECHLCSATVPILHYAKSALNSANGSRMLLTRQSNGLCPKSAPSIQWIRSHN